MNCCTTPDGARRLDLAGPCPCLTRPFPLLPFPNRIHRCCRIVNGSSRATFRTVASASLAQGIYVGGYQNGSPRLFSALVNLGDFGPVAVNVTNNAAL